MNNNDRCFEFDRIDLTDLIIVVSLAVGLIMAVYMHEKELSMSIVSGMFGYVGGGYVKQSQKTSQSSRFNNQQLPDAGKKQSDLVSVSVSGNKITKVTK